MFKELILMTIMMLMMKQIMGVDGNDEEEIAYMTMSWKSKMLTMIMKIIMLLAMRKKDADKDHVR